MKPFRSSLCGALLVATLGLGACGMTPAADSITLSARLSGAAEVPPNASSGSGTLQASLNKQTLLLSWTVDYAGLSGPASAAHFHGPAIPGDNAGVAVPITGSLDSPIKGTATLTAAQMSDLLAGKWYFNVHTAANPGGEIRGQITN